MEHKYSDSGIPLQPLMKSSDGVEHEQAELKEANQGEEEQKKKHLWLKRCVSLKWKSVFIAITTLLGYILLNLAISAIAPFYSILVSLVSLQIIEPLYWLPIYYIYIYIYICTLTKVHTLAMSRKFVVLD